MAQLHPVRFRAMDANGALVSGAGLFIYEVGTSTLADLFSDADLTIPTANPVISGSTGYWAQFYTASGQTFDIQARATSSAVSTLLWQALEVDSLGSEDLSTFFRNYEGNGRVQIVGATGVPRMEFGPPTNDNIGGGVIISGWNGTDLESADWKGPLDVTGDGSFGGDVDVTGFIPADKVLSSGTAAAAATTTIALPTGYDCYVLDIAYLTPSTALTVEVLFAFDVGGTMKVGADDYAWSIWDRGPTSGTSSAADNSDDSMATVSFVAAPTTPTGTPSRAQIEISSAVGKETGIVGNAFIADNGTDYGQKRYEFVGMTRAKNYGKATFIQVKATAGNLSFKYVLKGVRSL